MAFFSFKIFHLRSSEKLLVIISSNIFFPRPCHFLSASENPIKWILTFLLPSSITLFYYLPPLYPSIMPSRKLPPDLPTCSISLHLHPFCHSTHPEFCSQVCLLIPVSRIHFLLLLRIFIIIPFSYADGNMNSAPTSTGCQFSFIRLYLSASRYSSGEVRSYSSTPRTPSNKPPTSPRGKAGIQSLTRTKGLPPHHLSGLTPLRSSSLLAPATQIPAGLQPGLLLPQNFCSCCHLRLIKDHSVLIPSPPS